MNTRIIKKIYDYFCIYIKEINMFSKRSANLDEIIDNDQNLSQEEILMSKDFQTNLINDLVNNKKNIESWEVYDKNGSIRDLKDNEDTDFSINYTFNFVYNYKNNKIPLTIFINGNVDVTWIGKFISQSHLQPAEYPEPEIDEKNLGRMLDFALFDNDGTEVDISWLTPELKRKVAKSIISPYI